jgi:Bacterial surface proteins containing Ig-like domains
MKSRFLLLLSVLALACPAVHGQKVTEDEANAVAARALGVAKSAAVRCALKNAPEKAPSASESAPVCYFYKQKSGKGFAIVSGDKRITPLIGYSDTESIDVDNLPVQLTALLDSMQTRVERMDRKAPVHPGWHAATGENPAGERLLSTAEWGQGEPYNSESPVVDGVQAPTGCVATSMSIVMKYHGFPEKGQKTITDWNPTSDAWEEHDYSKDTFNWALMQDSYTAENPGNEASRNEVAHLMRCAGISVNMNYYQNESGAPVLNAAVALHRYFNYSADVAQYHKDLYDEAEWYNRVRSNIDAGHPVIYFGEGTGAHAFVLDGYDNSDKFHINWGWDGAANGYYDLDALSPLEFSFNLFQGMISNIHPAEAGEIIWSDCFMAAQGVFAMDYIDHINISTEEVKKGEPFDIVSGYLSTPHGFKGSYGIAHTDKDLRIKSIVCSRTVAPNNSRGVEGLRINFYDIKTNEDVEEGDRLYIATLENNDEGWRLVKQSGDEPTSIAMKGNKPQWCEIEWVTDPRLTYEIHDGFDTYRRTFTGEELTEESSKFLKGSYYMIHPIGFSSSRGDFTAVKVNDILIDVCGDTYPVLINPCFMDDRYKIEFLGSKKEERFDENLADVTPGSVAEKLQGKRAYDINQLKVTGTINGKDIDFIRNNMPFLCTLDLSDATCAGGTALASGTFIQNTMKSVSLPEGLKEVPYVFASGSLKYLTLPSTIEKTDAMMCGFENGASVFVKSMIVPEIVKTRFQIIPENGTLYVLPDMLEAFKEAPYWKEFPNIEESENPVMEDISVTEGGLIYSLERDHFTVIGAADDCPEEPVFASALQYDGKEYPVTEIGYKAFLYNRSIHKVKLPKSITTIGIGAFAVSHITEFDAEDNSFTSIPTNMFENTSSLQRVRIPEGVTSLGQYSISGAGNLEHIELPSTLKDITWNSIAGHNLKEILLAEGNPYYKMVDGAMYSHDMTRLCLYPMGQKIESIRIPEGVKYMNWYMFQKNDNSYSIKEIILPTTLLEIPPSSFNTITGLESFVIPDNVRQVGEWSVPLGKNTVIGKSVGKPISDSNIVSTEMKRVTVRQCRLDGNSFWDSYDVSNVYLENETVISLEDFFGDDIRKRNNPVRVYSPKTAPNFSFVSTSDEKPNMSLFVPGGVRESLSNSEKEIAHEMWDYAIAPSAGKLTVAPLYSSVEINKVEVNGAAAEKKDGVYSFTPAESATVKVTYTLNGFHTTSTEYDADFNSTHRFATVALSAACRYIEKGETMKAEAISLSDEALTWSSSDDAVATVDPNGEITAKSPGKAVITVTAGTETKSMELNVFEINTGIAKRGSHQEYSMIGRNIEIKGIDEPLNVEVLYNDVASTVPVRLEPLEPGRYLVERQIIVPWRHNIILTCVTPDWEKEYVLPTEIYRMVDEIYMPESYYQVEIGQSCTIAANPVPENADYPQLDWESDNPEIATVDSEGKVTGISAGNTVVRATATDGSEVSAACNVEVMQQSGINGIGTDGIAVRGINGSIVVTGVSDDTEISVYDVCGETVYRGTEHEVRGLSAGVYIVAVSGKVFKIAI